MEQPPQRIGPYRILSRLGSGGMGEVFLAYDERLDRRVAIKRIRRDGGDPPERRERFLREARLAARLSHPAIVQVHDLLTEDDTDHLVLEYVEGENLRLLHRRGRLPVPQVLGLAGQIAAGLREAHRHGIIHRDLKTENVLVTPAGQAKITDFGIAKRLEDAGTDESLTSTGSVLGTYRAMSPEQARGQTVDHRTDLFSFGILLYELLTGRSPFEAANPLSTVDRIVHERHAPVREINPEVPEELSRIVDALLEKDPGLRPQNAGMVLRDLEEIADGITIETAPTLTTAETEVAIPRAPAVLIRALQPEPTRHHRRLGIAAILLLSVIGATGYLAIRPAAEPLYVGVLPPEIGTGADSPRAELLATGLRVALLKGLIELQGISPLSFQEVDEATGSPKEIARTVSADELIGSQLDCHGETCRLSITRLGLGDVPLWVDSFEVPADDVSLLSQVVMQRLQGAYSDLHSRTETPDLQVSRGDLERLLRLRMKMDSDPGTAFDEVFAELEALRRRHPRSPEILLLEARAARLRFARSRSPADLDRASRLIQQAHQVVPSSPEPLLLQFDVALAGNDLKTAEQTLQVLEKFLPGDVRVLDRRAFLGVAQGRPEEGIEQLRKAARRNPSARRLSYLAQLELQHGQLDQARGHLELLLERSPGNSKGLSALAALELLHGDLQRALSLYQELVRSSPGMVQLSNLGFAYLLLKDYSQAEKIFQRGVDLEPGNALTLLNLADTHLLQGKSVTARVLYARVAELAAADPASGSAALLTVKAQALAHLGRGPEAVAAVQEALRLAPAQGPVAYEASVVYALLHEESSALVNARRALELGVAPRQFNLPWFDGLRRRPELRKMFQEPGP